MDERDRYQMGRDVILEVWGQEHGSELMERLKALSPDLERQIVAHLYGDLWTRGAPAPDRKMRSLISIAALTALNRSNQLRVHLIGALNNGASEQEIVELILQVGLLAGFPTSWDGLIACGKVFQEYRDGRFHSAAEAADATAESFGG